MKKNKIWVFYHIADSDGMSSAFLLKWAFDNLILKIPVNDNKIGLIPFNYNWDVPFEKIDKNDIVFWLDVSGTPAEMNILYDKVDGNFFWIDHHESIKEEHKELYEKCMGIIDTKRASCQNVYKFIEENGKFTKENRILFNKMKPFIDILGSCDIWDISVTDDDIDRWYIEYLSVKFALEANDIDPKTKGGQNFWNDFLDVLEKDDYDSFIEGLRYDGSVIMSFFNNRNADLCKSYGFSATIEGLKVFALNQGIGGTFIFNSVDLEKYDAVLCFIRSGKSDLYSVSLYTNKKEVNLLKTLSHLGFSGHKSAGGFKCKNFEIVINGNERNIIIS